jgi:hypothetical protein
MLSYPLLQTHHQSKVQGFDCELLILGLEIVLADVLYFKTQLPNFLSSTYSYIP